MKRAFLTVLVLLLLAEQVCAFQTELPRELAEAAPEAAALLETEDDSLGLAQGAAALLSRSLDAAREWLLGGIRSALALMLGVLLLGTVESLWPEDRHLTERCTTAAGALWITAVSAGDVSSLIGLGRETIGEVSAFSKVLLPSLAAVTAASGSVTAASVRQVAAVFFSDLLLSVIDGLLLPMVYLYIGVSTAGAVLDTAVMDRIGTLLKKLIGWCLAGLLTAFTTYLTISGAVAGSVDQQTLRAAKAAVSGVVPVVGGILAEAAESVLAGAGLLRGMIGAFGALAVLGLCLTPFLRLLAQYLLYQCAGLLAETAGPKRLAQLIARLGDAFGLVLAMTAAAALSLIISLLAALQAVTV